MFSPFLCWFAPGTPAALLSNSMQIGIRLIADLLTVDSNVSVNGFLCMLALWYSGDLRGG